MNTLARPWRVLLAAVLVASTFAVLTGAQGCQMGGEAAQRDLTVLLVEYEGPEAAASARRLAQELTTQSLPNVFIVEGANEASVCVGRYKSWKDADADAMLKRVRLIRDARGQYPFAGVMLVPVPEPMPESRWPLEKANGLFTLHVGSWEAPGRLRNAEAYTEELRSRGLEAYAYHGPRLSMVTIGAFGLNIFDDPSKVGQPGAKPKIVDRAVLDLIQKFPRMRLEGQEVPPEAHVPTQLVRVPGREPPAVPSITRPKTLYRISVSLIDARTGLAEGRASAAGVAQSKPQIPWLVGTLVKQVMESVEANGRARVGVVGVMATDAESAKERVEAVALESLVAALRVAGAGKIALFSPEGTRQMLDAAGLQPAAVLRDPRLAKGLAGLDLLAVGTVTSFSASPGAPEPGAK